jgi:alcohol dehydrogenase YqhD (iron-dependent ADH family)
MRILKHILEFDRWLEAENEKRVDRARVLLHFMDDHLKKNGGDTKQKGELIYYIPHKYEIDGVYSNCKYVGLYNALALFRAVDPEDEYSNGENSIIVHVDDDLKVHTGIK